MKKVVLSTVLWAQLSSCALPGPQIGMPRHIGLEVAHQAGEFDRDVGHLGAGIWQLIAAPSNDRNTLIRLLDTTDRAVQEAERFWCFLLSFEGLRGWEEIFAQMSQGYLFGYNNALEDAE